MNTLKHKSHEHPPAARSRASVVVLTGAELNMLSFFFIIFTGTLLLRHIDVNKPTFLSV